MDQKEQRDQSKKVRRRTKGRVKGKTSTTPTDPSVLPIILPIDPTSNTFGRLTDQKIEPEKCIPIGELRMTSELVQAEDGGGSPTHESDAPSLPEKETATPVLPSPGSEVHPVDPPPPPPPLVLRMPERIHDNNHEPRFQDPNFLTTPTTGENELDHGHSFSYPKSESGSMGFSGRNRRLSGIRGDERTRKISIGIGGVPKKGYWGGMDDSSDSDDSLLAQTSSNKRRKSSTFILGPKLMGYNRRQWLILIVIAMVDFCSGALISIQAPIYPPEATTRGVTPTTYGILFGVFELTIFLMTPTFFNLLRKVDMKVMFNFGILTTGVSAIMFSFLDRIDDKSLFLTCSFVLRITEAIGDAAILTGAYAIVTLEFPDSVANTFTSLEAFLGIGFIVGPPLAGFLFEVDGFMLPFLLFGVLILASGVLSLTILPKKLKEDNPSGELRKPAFLSLLRIPSVALASFSILTATISLGFLNSTLYAHLTQFTLSAAAVGGIFILVQGMYILSAPVWNILINRVSDPKYVSILATILIFVAFLFVGPAEFIPIDANLEVTCTALALGGIALGGLLVSGFLLIQQETINNGFPDNEATFGMSSGLYASIFAFGSCIGLSSSGILYDNVGFRWGCVFPLSFHAILALMTILYLFVPKPELPMTPIPHRSRHNSEFHESEPLLSHSPDLGKSDSQQQRAASSRKPGGSYGTSTSYESIA